MGFAAILRCDSLNLYRELSGAADDGTNNRGELSAAIMGLAALKARCIVTIRSDSEYVVLGITERRAHKARDNGWTKRDRSKFTVNKRQFVATGNLLPGDQALGKALFFRQISSRRGKREPG